MAVVVLLWRLARKESLQPAISGFIGVAFCAAIAWFMGDAKGYFVYGIWYSLILGIAFVVSIVARWPLVGVIWRGINGEDQRWRTNREAVRGYSIATAAWAVLFLARFAVQQDACAADGLAVLGRQQVEGAVVQPVDLAILGDALLLDEHGAAQGKAGGKVGGLFDLHSKYFSRIRW